MEITHYYAITVQRNTLVNYMIILTNVFLMTIFIQLKGECSNTVEYYPVLIREILYFSGRRIVNDPWVWEKHTRALITLQVQGNQVLEKNAAVSSRAHASSRSRWMFHFSLFLPFFARGVLEKTRRNVNAHERNVMLDTIFFSTALTRIMRIICTEQKDLIRVKHDGSED